MVGFALRDQRNKEERSQRPVCIAKNSHGLWFERKELKRVTQQMGAFGVIWSFLKAGWVAGQARRSHAGQLDLLPRLAAVCRHSLCEKGMSV